MADRIFPNTVKKIAGKKEYNGINWSSVEEQLAKLTKTAQKEENVQEKLMRFLDKHPRFKQKLAKAGKSIQEKISKLIHSDMTLLDEANDGRLVQTLDLAFPEVEVDEDITEEAPLESFASDYGLGDDGMGDESEDGLEDEVEASAKYADEDSDDSEDDDSDEDDFDEGTDSDNSDETDDDEITEAKAFLSKLAAKGEIPEGLKKYQESKKGGAEDKGSAGTCGFCKEKSKTMKKDGKNCCAKCAKTKKCALKNCGKSMMVGKMSKVDGKDYCCKNCAKKDGKEKVASIDNKSEFFEKMDKEKSKNSNGGRKVISFTNLNQINAEAVLAAEAAGDEKLKQTILDARHQRRMVIASQIEKAQELETQTKSEINDFEKRKAFRESLIKTAMEKDQNVKEDYGFKPISDLSFTEQDSFMKLAVKNGFPKEYVISMITPELEDTTHLKPILEVITNKEMSRESQVAAVTAMIKTSELSQKDLNYLKNYWSNQLGYPAKDWVDALFTSKFYKRIGKKDSSEN